MSYCQDCADLLRERDALRTRGCTQCGGALDASGTCRDCAEQSERLINENDALRTRLKMAEARYDTLALGIGYAEQPMGHHGVQAAEPATIIAAWKEMEARLAQGEGERDRLLHAALTAPDRAALVARERAREAVVEAAPRVLSWLDEIVHLDRVPRACGACGTPNASCDMDCANAAYMSRDTRALRAALDALAGAGTEDRGDG